MSNGPDDPTDVMPEDDEDPTERLDAGEDEPTRNLPGGSADPNDRFDSARGAGTEEMRVRGLASGDLPPETHVTEARPVTPEQSRKYGVWMLVASIAASVILVGIYIAAGGLDYKPAGAADPCDAREWTDPGNLEETAQQFALSATDGAACDLGVSREELIRALADEESRARFAEENGLSESEIEEAIRSGLFRAIDDAENAGAISGLVATGLRAAAKVMPINEMIPLIEDASGFLSGDSLNGVSDLIDGVFDSLGGDSGDSGDSGATGDGGSLGDQLRDAVPDGVSGDLPKDLTDRLRDQLPEDLQREIPDSVDERIQKELDGLLNP
ncbi:MAG TPA: hypothetical protein VMF31_01600 [Solirubrobacterales bacterium]|nr:hypothetical protein [Solirubrobacterales bacterium]